ncbi:MAG: hypothetical protein JSS63_02475 [Bacteroidetes bacterium]|nr:hypothetical protein [Bacteroidota bacterium]
MFKINLEKFYTGYRQKFGSLSQGQVDGLNFLIECFEKSRLINRLSEFAYILATVKHETAETFQPIEERGGWNYFKYLIGKLGIKNLSEANRYKGRGYVQLTGKVNYQLFTELLGIDFINQPEITMQKLYAWMILEIGMTRGLFTGKKLQDYIKENSRDFFNARRIINGLDKAGLIASYANDFYEILEFE